MTPIDRNCILMFDGILLSKQLTFDKSKNMIIGYVDLGHLGRVNKPPNHALVFMVHGLHNNRKQPVAFFFTRITVESKSLQSLIKDIIIALKAAGLVVLATVCDQGATNCKSISNTISNPYNNLAADAIHTAEFIHDIDCLFDSFNGRLPSPELGKAVSRKYRAGTLFLHNRAKPRCYLKPAGSITSMRYANYALIINYYGRYAGA
ncbi:hypothetical protein YQE_04718, partial [Dendroctonus ponderosae]